MYDYNVVDKLIDIEKKILNSFIKLSYENDAEKYYKEFDFLKDVLLKKEDLLISKLPVDDVLLNTILDDILDNKNNFFDSKFDEYFILERIKNIFDNLIIVYDESFSDDDEFIDSPKIRSVVNNNLKFMFLEYNDCFLSKNYDLFYFFENIKFLEIFTSKNLSSFLINKDFMFISSLNDSKLSDDLDMDLDDYNVVKNDEIYNCLEDLICSLLDVLSDDNSSSIFSYLLLKFKFYIHTISNEQLLVFMNYFEDIISPFSDEKYINDFIYSLDFELKKRGLNIVEKNKSVQKIDDVCISNLIHLIKLEGRLYEMYNLLDIQNINNSIVSCLRYFIYLENNLIKKININDSNHLIIKGMIESDLSFFLPFNSEDLNIISRRLLGILPYFKSLDVSPTQSYMSYYYINCNHVIRSINNYVNNIDNQDNDYLDYLKYLLFINNFLTFDFLVSGGNYNMIEDLDDSIICKLLDSKFIEFIYDQDEQLTRRADEIVSELQDFPFDYEPYVYYRLLELNDIMSNVSEDYLNDIINNVIPVDLYDKKNVNKVYKNNKNILRSLYVE